MGADQPSRANVALTSEFSDLVVEIDPVDGSPVALVRGDQRLPLETRVTLVTGGTEARAPQGGLDYLGTVEVALAAGAVYDREHLHLDSRTHSIDVATTSHDWRVVWHYDMRQATPALALRLEVVCLRAGAVLRNVRVEMTVRVGEVDGWRLQAPGSKVRADLDLRDLAYVTTVQTVAGVESSSGLVVIERAEEPLSFLMWPLSLSNYGEIALGPTAGGALMQWTTDVAGAPTAGGSLVAGPLMLDVVPEPFDDVLSTVPSMLADSGIAGPDDPPSWAAEVNLYEVQIGFGVFRGGWRYEPYPTPQHLLDDLDRIVGLGYNCLQIMPQQPYPSYNVHDYDDISTSWCDEAMLRRIVDGCHARGMRIILDILMHGVIDNEAMDAAVAAIDAGPYVARLEETTPDVTTLERDEMHYYFVAWSRHVKDFEPFWRAGSPNRHPLVDEHPEWFTRDSAGAITGVYTQAFDLAHPGWQDYFVEKAVGIMQRLGIDGYRFDAPSYNYFMNWSERTRTDASVSMLGCLPMFAKLRSAMRAANPESLLYTEPSGALYRVSMDLAYNYDEQFLVPAVVQRGAGKSHWIRNARELGRWLEVRDATLPRGSLTAHHLDSHDTFWWPEPGQKWRREQFGLPATAALMAVFCLSGGPYMTYVGGEVGIEDEVAATARIRREHRNFARGRSDYRSATAGHDDVYAVIRESEDGRGLLLVNLSDERVVSTVVVRSPDAIAAQVVTADLMGGKALAWARGPGGLWAAEIVLDGYQVAAFDLKHLS
ncbi:alpha-amylase family glycosyl hydrolase [Kineosporia sp. A_224]|uniref:alpha-amylase family glycosyl hydrolase n=1 Tax=Kineosporia sp. A_224 TaxID=1962180 RepID=UPI000B4AD2AF|nr:alpha-amylase family glycosyl hydrolase [Kineosporia sp. A_224]